MPSSLSPPLPTPPPPLRRLHLAVVGAGAAGLAAARELRREGHGVVVFETAASVGGTWIYTPFVESDPLGLDPNRSVIQSSLYSSLRTNLPRESMGFLDYPFIARHGGGDSRRFPGHREVLRYLEGFAREFDLYRFVRFRTEVVKVEREEGKWKVRSRKVNGGGGDENEVYDGVLVCNGHYTEPRLAEIPGMDVWPGKQMHSHSYRLPDPFIDQVVVIIGSAASAVDISRDIAAVAKEVHIASRQPPDGSPIKLPGYDNMWLHSMVKILSPGHGPLMLLYFASQIENTHQDGLVVFQDGSSVYVDVIMHCTGYKYHFPFLETDGIVIVDDNRVGPLYKHVFPPELAPGLSFIGLPWKVIPFPLVELQSKWVARVLSGQIELPTKEEMLEDVKALYSELEIAGQPKRYTHNLSNIQFEYDDWLADQCGHPPVESWRKEMYAATTKNKRSHPEIYRDEWDDDHLIAQANEDFRKFL